MNIKDRMIMEEFKRERVNYLKLEEIVGDTLRGIVQESNVWVMGVEHRVKKENSLEVKLYKNGEFYQKLADLTDVLGARIICYFADDVDKIGKLVEEKFEIDRTLSSDKRALLKADTFGYISLHYICSLKNDPHYPEELRNKRFEIQIRTILQHAWAAINHDLGYKTEFGVPRETIRSFARLAGLLELADDEFVRARDKIKEYTEIIRTKIINDDANDVDVDLISIREYMLRNTKMRAFLSRLAQIESSEITESEPDAYIPQLKFLKIDTIGKLQALLEKREERAYSLAKRILDGSELDILSSNVALRYLCQAELLDGGYTEEEAVEFILLTTKDRTRAERQAKRLFTAK